MGPLAYYVRYEMAHGRLKNPGQLSKFTLYAIYYMLNVMCRPVDGRRHFLFVLWVTNDARPNT